MTLPHPPLHWQLEAGTREGHSGVLKVKFVSLYMRDALQATRGCGQLFWVG